MQLTRFFLLSLFMCSSICAKVSNPILQAGQFFILSAPNTNDLDAIASWLEKTKPAGVMLSSFHCQDRQQTKKLVASMQQKMKKMGMPPLFIAIDWEGGVVSRPNESGGFVSVPSPWKVAQTGLSECFSAGAIIGNQLHDVGVTMNFAPCLDLFDQTNPIMATRCFSSDPEKTCASANQFASGLLAFNVLPVFKHFPGLGLAMVDSHTHKTVIGASRQQREKHMLPFKKMATSFCQPFGIMVSHAIVPSWGMQPLTSNPQAVLFFEKLNANNRPLFITDDFSMKAAAPDGSIEQAVVNSIIAGFDLLIYSALPEKQIEMIKTVQQHIATLDYTTQARLKTRIAKSTMFKQLFLQRKMDGPVFDVSNAARFLVKRCLQPTKPVPSLVGKKVVMLSVDLEKIRSSECWFCRQGHSYLYHALVACNVRPVEYLFNPKDTGSVQRAKQFLAAQASRPGAMIIAQTYFYNSNSIENKLQEQLLALLKPYRQHVVSVSLFHPGQNACVPCAYHMQLGSFHQPLLDQVAHLLTQPLIQTGADQLMANPGRYLEKKSFGLLTSRSSFALYQGQWMPLVDALHGWTQQKSNAAKMAALFGPEHGLTGFAEAGAGISSNKSSRWGCPVYSLYGKTRKPQREWLAGLDVLIIDLQDVGVRCFTYMSTIMLAVGAAQEVGVPVIILDRPNPLAFWRSKQLALDRDYQSFVGSIDVPFLHGMTPGMMVQKFFSSKKSPIIILSGKAGAEFLFERPYISPSPNLPTIDHLHAYPMTVFFEGTNYSEGRGTSYPFLNVGAPWVDGKKYAQFLNACHLPGIYFQPTTFTPHALSGKAESPKHCGQCCGGVFVHILDPDNIQPLSVSLALLETLKKLYPKSHQWKRSGNRYFVDLLSGGSALRGSVDGEGKS